MVTLPLLVLTACAPADEPSGSGSSGATSSGATSSDGTSSDATSATSAVACAAGALPTIADRLFTVGTDDPAYEPWFADNDPTNGRGYESAVAYAVADRLGYEKDAVTWATATFTNAIAPGVKNFDVDVNQISITDERRQTVDFSSGYYDVAQAVVALDSSPIAGVTTIAALKNAKLGAQVGTTSYRTITETIAPSQQPLVFDTNDLAKQSLVNGQIDGLIVDLPTGLYLAAAELEGAKVVGQFPVTGDVEQFGFVLDKGSALTSCVSGAVEELRADGTLATIQQQWFTSSTGAPELS
ncbi:MAG: ABC transporter substrate-binding protein [Janthinobacterium lividum]